MSGLPVDWGKVPRPYVPVWYWVLVSECGAVVATGTLLTMHRKKMFLRDFYKMKGWPGSWHVEPVTEASAFGG